MLLFFYSLDTGGTLGIATVYWKLNKNLSDWSKPYKCFLIGAAYIGKICGPHLNVGYIRDDGNFAGVQVAAHELGHL